MKSNLEEIQSALVTKSKEGQKAVEEWKASKRNALSAVEAVSWSCMLGDLSFLIYIQHSSLCKAWDKERSSALFMDRYKLLLEREKTFAHL